MGTLIYQCEGTWCADVCGTVITDLPSREHALAYAVSRLAQRCSSTNELLQHMHNTFRRIVEDPRTPEWITTRIAENLPNKPAREQQLEALVDSLEKLYEVLNDTEVAIYNRLIIHLYRHRDTPEWIREAVDQASVPVRAETDYERQEMVFRNASPS